MLTFITVFRRLFLKAKTVSHRILPKLSAMYHKKHSAVFSSRVLNRLLLGPNVNDVLSSFGDHISFEKMTPAQLIDSLVTYNSDSKTSIIYYQIFVFDNYHVELRLQKSFDTHSNSLLQNYKRNIMYLVPRND